MVQNAQSVKLKRNLIKLAKQKIDGIQPISLTMDEINTSYFDGALSQNQLEDLDDIDSESDSPFYENLIQ